jgi:penicillin-insensitive murein DD-endopeptidase
LKTLLYFTFIFSLSGIVEAVDIKAQRTTPAKKLFSSVELPAPMEPHAIGSYAKGCLAGAEKLPANGPGWQTMRLFRNRYWGHPELIDFIKRLAKDATEKDGWPGLLVGDLTQPRGGPMPGGHASHQIGLDVDIWLKPMPQKILTNKERNNISAVSMKKNNREINPKTWTTGHAKLLRRAASDEKVARIFIHPSIKKQMCEWSKGQKDRTWLRKLRPWYGHHYHFHVRLKCPAGDSGCKNQPAPPPGPGCGEKLAWWLSDKPYKKAPPKPPGTKPVKPRQVLLADLPKECTIVLNKQIDSKKKVAAKINQAPDKALPTSGYLQ